mgnify:CR=1 FL=1
MRAAVLGVLVVLGLVIVAVGAGPDRSEPSVPRVPWSQLQSSLANADMIAVSANVGEQYQQLTLIDPKQRVMSVYHIDFATGTIALKGVRNFHYDQQLTQYNCRDPLPEDLKSLVLPR